MSYQRQLMQSMLFDVTYTGSVTEHIWVSGFSENPTHLHSWELRGRAVRADGGRSVLEHARRLTAMRGGSSRCSTRLKVRTSAGTDQLYPDGDGRYNGVEVLAVETHVEQLERQHELHLSKCINQGEPSTDIGGGSFPGIGNVVEIGSGDTRDWLTESSRTRSRTKGTARPIGGTSSI